MLTLKWVYEQTLLWIVSSDEFFSIDPVASFLLAHGSPGVRARILPSVSVSMTPTLLLTPKSTSSPGIVTSTGVKESWNSHRSGRTVSESSIWKKLFSFPEFRPSSLFKWDLGKGSFLKVLFSIEFGIDSVQDGIEEESHILSLRRSTRFLEKASVFINFGCRLEAW